ncbi:hypothetical protein AGMMS49949_00280 [Alphaproteobacteria bacterium]|nr:hypothetical protein AGMMS49949_00280 [Alphaproteobacteria bacterium]GHS97279.1 hypothetical protein AGMMS50296_4140 [Alphaproteobacteria bacterium]
MNILSFCSTTEAVFFALSYQGRVFEKQAEWTATYTQSSGIVPCVQALVKETDFDFKDLDVIVAPKGPTSFTTLRVTLTFAKALLFCCPNAKPFSPSQFHVLAFSVREQVPLDQDFLVLIDSYKYGFFGSIFHKDASGKLRMKPYPAFYDQETGVTFLKQNQDLPLVHNFSKNSFAFNFLNYAKGSLLEPHGNFACTQLTLYQDSPPFEDFFDSSSFTPFYLHTPSYKKTGFLQQADLG